VKRRSRVKEIKSRYRRSTPVLRLHKNVDKVYKISSLVRDRLSSWTRTSAPDPRVVRCLELVASSLETVQQISRGVRELDLSGYVPPARPKPTDYEVGEHVRVVKDHRAKYELTYKVQLANNSKLLDELVVHQKLPTGELVVRHTPRSQPIIVRKSHVARIVVS
jgi:hypothetical protein